MSTKLFGFRIVLALLLLVIGSWVAVHVLAVFGIFLAAAYPIWWLVSPSSTPCLICHAKPEGSYCHLCRREIHKLERTSPATMASALLNAGLIVFLTLISIGVVYLESQALKRLGIAETPKTASFYIPDQGQYRLGEIFPVKIDINNIDTPINVVQADVGFDPTKLEVVDVSTKDSFANIFIQKEINNEGGWARLTGGLPNPGFHGSYATFGVVYFRSKSPGLAQITFLDSSKVLANDARGTDILKEFPSVSYLILPDRISASEERSQDQLIENLSILGASSDIEEQLTFYSEDAVLGATISNIEEPDITVENNSLLDALKGLDAAILGLWGRLFGN